MANSCEKRGLTRRAQNLLEAMGNPMDALERAKGKLETQRSLDELSKKTLTKHVPNIRVIVKEDAPPIHPGQLTKRVGYHWKNDSSQA